MNRVYGQSNGVSHYSIAFSLEYTIEIQPSNRHETNDNNMALERRGRHKKKRPSERERERATEFLCIDFILYRVDILCSVYCTELQSVIENE